MLKYYKLFTLLENRNMKKKDLLEILSPGTIAKLSKGENLSTETIDKLCLFLKCQPNDIMECFEVIEHTKQNGERKIYLIKPEAQEVWLNNEIEAQKAIAEREHYLKIAKELDSDITNISE